MKTAPKPHFYFPRAPLLVEIERRCRFADCGGKNLIALTKGEVIEYRGFDCSHCERWNEDKVSVPELPDSWASPNIDPQSK